MFQVRYMLKYYVELGPFTLNWKCHKSLMKRIKQLCVCHPVLQQTSPIAQKKMHVLLYPTISACITQCFWLGASEDSFQADTEHFALHQQCMGNTNKTLLSPSTSM